MSEYEREKWDRRYAEGDYRPRTSPSPFLERCLERIPVGGRAVDLACGTGRNALRLAEAGFDVDAVDISGVAIEKGRAEAQARGLDIGWQVADLDGLPIPSRTYRIVAMFRYLNRDLWDRMIEGLEFDGWIVVEQHLKSHRTVAGPPDDFRLEPGELLDVFSALRIVHYDEAIEADRDGSMRALARLAACRGDPGF